MSQGVVHGISTYGQAEAILALYPAPRESRRANKEQVLAVLHKNVPLSLRMAYEVEHDSWWPRLVDDLLALLNAEERKEPEWCPCWASKGGNRWLRAGSDSAILSNWAMTNWNNCPYCGAPRPSREEGK